ncbi:MAG: hypothetical protein IK092_04515 [Muribaculaceae bacterium]|nr:hypothetical protein [Muribaculaceae bacterium]
MKFQCPKCGASIEMSDTELIDSLYSTVCPQCDSQLKIVGDYAYIPIEGEDFGVPTDAANKPTSVSDAAEDIEVETLEHGTDRVESRTAAGEGDFDTLFDPAVEYIKTCNAISLPMLMHYFDIPAERAAELMKLLEQRGIVGPFVPGKPRKILIEHNQGLPGGVNRTYAADEEVRQFLREHAEQNGGKVKTVGGNCSCFSIILIAFIIYLIVSMFK